MYKQFFAGRDGVVYAVTASGDLLWTRYTGLDDLTARWAQPRPALVSGGWGDHRRVFASTHGVIYALDKDGDLVWARHLGHQSGTAEWAGAPVKVGFGWGGLVHIVAGDDGDLYAVAANGTLVLYRHSGWQNGAVAWEIAAVDSGWEVYNAVFAGSDGVLYGRLADGTLRWHRHLGRATMSGQWDGPKVVGYGWNLAAQVVTSDRGAFFVRYPAGRIAAYLHDGHGTGTLDWRYAADIGTSLSPTLGLRASAGRFIAVGPSSVAADHDALDDDATFTTIRLGDAQIALRSHDQRVLSTNAAGDLSLDADTGLHGAAETFAIHELSGGGIALQGANDRYVSSDAAGVLRVDAPLIGASEGFAVYPVGAVEIAGLPGPPPVMVAPPLDATPTIAGPLPPADTAADPAPDTAPPPARPTMRYLIRPLVPFAASTPGYTGSQGRSFTIASEQTGMVLTVRDEIAWHPVVDDAIVRMDVGVDGAAWGVRADGSIRRWNGGGWDTIAGALAQVSVGSATEVWGVTPSYGIVRWKSGAWETVPGALAQVAVAADGSAWGVTTNGQPARYLATANTWETVDGAITQISVGNRETVWAVNASHEVFLRRAFDWEKIPGALKQVAATEDGSVFGVTPGDQVVRWDGRGWSPVAAGPTSIAAGTATDVWGLGGGLVRSQGGERRAVQQLWIGDARQKWRMRPNGDGTFRIESAAAVKVLAAPVGSSNAGDPLIATTWTGGDEQRWWVLPLDDGRFRIQSVGSTLSLALDAEEPGAAAVQQRWVDRGHQRWRLCEVVAPAAASPAVQLYNARYYGGPATQFGMGSYNTDVLNRLPNPNFASARVPLGLKVSFLTEMGFRGSIRSLTQDTATIPDYETETTNSIVVEPVATFYRDPNFQGPSVALGMGRINLSRTSIGDNALSSLRVPPGVVVTLHADNDFAGERRVFFEDVADLGAEWSDRASSVEIRVTGLIIPRDSIRFGGHFSLRGAAGKWIKVAPGGAVSADAPSPQAWEKLSMVRMGPSQHLSHIAYGDVVALRSAHATYLADAGGALAQVQVTGVDARWTIVRSGPGTSNVFVSAGDKVSFQNKSTGRYLSAQADGRAITVVALAVAETFSITDYLPPNLSGDASGPTTGSACNANTCVTEACIADACGVEACNVDTSLASACGVASAGYATCAADAAGLSACARAFAIAEACGADACGAAACFAAICGAAACGANACGLAASVVNVCGAATCGTDGSPLGACGADASGIGFCSVDVCGANVCGVNLCPVDACAADACGIDIIPLVPFI